MMNPAQAPKNTFKQIFSDGWEEFKRDIHYKSQFCLSCAKAYGQQWVGTVQAMLHPE